MSEEILIMSMDHFLKQAGMDFGRYMLRAKWLYLSKEGI